MLCTSTPINTWLCSYRMLAFLNQIVHHFFMDSTSNYPWAGGHHATSQQPTLCSCLDVHTRSSCPIPPPSPETCAGQPSFWEWHTIPQTWVLQLPLHLVGLTNALTIHKWAKRACKWTAGQPEFTQHMNTIWVRPLVMGYNPGWQVELAGHHKEVQVAWQKHRFKLLFVGI
jgi:hypothetical protein